MKVRINKVVQAFNRLIKVRPETTVGIDIGSGAIKVAEVRWGTNPQLKAVGIRELPADILREGYIANKALLAETLQQVLTVSGVDSRHAILSISGQSVVVRELKFPAMSNEELRQAIKWDLDKYIPSAEVENYYFDFAIISPAYQDQEMKVLLVAVPIERIDALTDLSKELGLKLLAIEIEPLALLRIMNNVHNSIIVDIGARLCQLHIFQQGVPVVSRSIPLGGIRFTEAIMRTLSMEFHEAEQMKVCRKFVLDSSGLLNKKTVIEEHMTILIAELSREIRRMIDYYKIQNSTAVIDNIILAGGGSQLNYLAGNLVKLLDGMQVVEYSPLTTVQLAPSLDSEWLTTMAPQLAVAIGLALRGGESA